MTDFTADDFEHTAKLLRSGNDAVRDATLSNNLNIILAALDAVPKLHAALLLTEAADFAHTECPECEGEGSAEECGTCFELADPARVARRAALGIPDIVDVPMDRTRTLDEIASDASGGRFASMQAILDYAQTNGIAKGDAP